MPKLHVGRQAADDNNKFEIDVASLTKHAIILGATGSGKTVLSKVLVEEAALQGIPTFAIDPKGDIGNLAFKSANFDFSRWSEKEADALKTDRVEYAKSLQKAYADRMAEFAVRQDAQAEFAKTVTVRIFTPKSSAGLPVGISPDLSAPKDFSKLLENDVSATADLLDLTSYNLLRLAGYGEGDRKEITFVSALLEDAWKSGQSVTVKDLIRKIESPPISTVGSLHVSDVLGDKDRRKLVTRINLLVSDPKLRSWSAAESLDFSELMKGPSINVLDLRNIQSEQEKHLFVELVLQRLFQWLIKQGSAQTLRYLLYFDEIAGYCPPVREPPSKKLLLLLIKQARAFGLGLLLASQNAVDLDYKVISNANVRFIGRLGAQRDIQRVSVGLELDSFAEKEISRLKAGEFFCNMFDPKFRGVIKSRWTLTYHRGPLENGEIAELMEGMKEKEKEKSQPSAAEQQEKITTTVALEEEKSAEEEEEKLLPKPEEKEIHHDPLVAAAGGAHATTFVQLERKFEPKNLQSFAKLGNNVSSIKVLSTEQEEVFHPVFELSASVFEKGYARQSLDKLEELAAFESQLVPLPAAHTLAPQRAVPAEARRKAEEKWNGELEKRTATLKADLQAKFDVIMEEKRVEHIAEKQARPKAKIANIDASIARLQEALNAELDSIKDQERLYKQLKKEKAKKSRLISAENRIETKKQKAVATRRKIEQLHTDRQALEDKLAEIEEEENEKFHDALSQVKSKSGFAVTGWLIETVYRARITVNDNKEHAGDVRWSSYTGRGTWGRCSVCSVPLESGSACNCGNLMCNHHLAYCKACLEPACMDHRALCYICNSTFCARHSAKCELCSLSACTSHSGACSVCNRKVCSNCSQKRGLIKREIVCRSCLSSSSL
ncbi:putative ATPase [Candidatus Nitrososphaera evergladensis SR1]|uniref:Putative ATPase n=1 Tax=Candidatus Nitrososphaera evergladensis SR1 TaxID=1459636 RepID=A0A075MY36_9ARCH|nr:ATP-binding protein [Candidatus Nitrososphaera evergladensis]AIF85572.1 putative ATPase [Candidatus Nitrososphaera evergladensis SR1]